MIRGIETKSWTDFVAAIAEAVAAGEDVVLTKQTEGSTHKATVGDDRSERTKE